MDKQVLGSGSLFTGVALLVPINSLNEEMVGPVIIVLLIVLFIVLFSHWYRQHTKGGGW